MAQRKNERLHVVREDEDLIQRMKQERQKLKTASRKKLLGFGLAVVLVILSVSAFVYMQTYTKARISDTYKVGNGSNNSYREFAEGVLKYSKDGVAYLDQKGREQWNHSYQIKNPIVEVNQEAVAIADRGGNAIHVFQRDGLKGEIQTTLPIEKVAVSNQGIIAVILKNETTPRIVCYDAAGNILVEHKASLEGIGYPLDLALSGDGEVLQVVYMSAQGANVSSKICYYNFGKKGANVADHMVLEKSYEKTLLAAGFFMDDTTSVAAGDNCITIYHGKDKPKEAAQITVKDEIQSVFHSDKYIGMITKKRGKDRYRLLLYNTSGKKIMEKTIDGMYKSAKISGSQAILYDGKKCCIYTKRGIHRFQGEMENHILEIFAIGGVNKYIVVDVNGMQNVRLVK